MKTFSMRPGAETSRYIKCPICAADRFRLYWQCDDFAFQRCSECGCIYQNPQPDQSELLSRYDAEYFEYERENEEGFHRLMRLSLEDIHFDRLSENFSRDRKRFLDIGCATGMLIESLAGEGWDTHGVEVCEPAARYGIEHRGVGISVGTLEDAEFPDSTFSVVHNSHLIEHLTDPKSFLRECRRILTDDGLLIVTTPNSDGFQARLFGPRWRSAIADHMILYSKKTIRKILISNGFEPLLFRTWGGLAVGAAPRFVKSPVDRMAKRFGFGDVMICVARVLTYG